MKSITKWVAEDGREFLDREECMKYEMIETKAKDIAWWLRQNEPDNIAMSENDAMDLARTLLRRFEITKLP
jgi:hypothetical protein